MEIFRYRPVFVLTHTPLIQSYSFWPDHEIFHLSQDSAMNSHLEIQEFSKSFKLLLYIDMNTLKILFYKKKIQVEKKY